MIIRSALANAVSYAMQSVIDAVSSDSASPAFNPDSLFRPEDVGAVLTISLATCFQDDAGTVPVTAVGQWVNSVRASDGALWSWSGFTSAATYEIDGDGYPHLRSTSGPPTGGWVLSPAVPLLDDWRDVSVVITARGLLVTAPDAVAAVGFVTTDGSGSGYAMATQPSIGFEGNTQASWTDISTYSPVSDARTTITSGRVRVAGSTLRINAEPDVVSATGYNPLPGPNIITGLQVSYDSSFYGAVVINRYIDDAELDDTIVWSEGLAYVDMSPFVAPVQRTPADLFVGAEPGAWFQYYLTPAQQRGAPNMLGFGDQLRSGITGGWAYSNMVRADTALPTPIAGVTAVMATSAIDDNANSPVAQNFLSLIAGKRYVFSVFLKRLNYDPISLTCVNFNNFSANYNLTTGAAESAVGAPQVTMTDAGGGWWRCAMSFVATTTVDSQFSIQLGGFDIDKDIGIGYYICGAMLEMSDSSIPSPYAHSTQTQQQQFRNAFPDAHLYQSNDAKVLVTAPGQPIFLCVDQSEPFVELVGTWTQTSGNGTAVVNGDTITITGGTDNLGLSFPGSPVGSVSYAELEVLSGNVDAVISYWCGGQPEPVLPGRNYYTGSNPVTGVNAMSFPPGEDFVIRIGPTMHSNANTWSAVSGAARPLYTFLPDGTALAVGDGIDDCGGTRSAVNFSNTDLVTMFAGIHRNAGITATEMVVWTGLTTTVEGAFGMWFENTQTLNVGKSSNNGTFIFIDELHDLGNRQKFVAANTVNSDPNLPGAEQFPMQRLNRVALSNVPGAIGGTDIGHFVNSTIWTWRQEVGSFIAPVAISDLVVIGRATTPEETTDTESFINSNLGAY